MKKWIVEVIFLIGIVLPTGVVAGEGGTLHKGNRILRNPYGQLPSVNPCNGSSGVPCNGAACGADHVYISCGIGFACLAWPQIIWRLK